MNLLDPNKYEGILLRKTPYGDSDFVLLFLTNRGTHSFFAKAAQRSRKRFSGQLDYFRRLSLVCTKKSERELFVLESCEVLEAWPSLWQDGDKYLLACVWIDLARKLLPPGKGTDIYRFICDSLRYLASEPLTVDLPLRFELRLSERLGYGPNFEGCGSCRALQAGAFSFVAGGLICERCIQAMAPSRRESLLLSPECAAWLRAYAHEGKAPGPLSDAQGRELRALLDLHWQQVGIEKERPPAARGFTP